MTKKIFIILVMGLVVFGVTKSSLAMMGMCGMGGGGGKGHSGHAEAAETKSSTQTAVEEVGNKMCPVSGEEINETTKAAYIYKGRTYNFCCPACIDEFKKSPEKYIEKLEAMEEKEAQGHKGHEGHSH